MTLFDETADLSYGTILSTDNATQFTLQAGQGAIFPTPVVGYYVEVFPAGSLPLISPAAASASAQCEWFRISAGGKSGDVFTWAARNQNGTPTRTILVGDHMCLPWSALAQKAIQNAVNAARSFAAFAG